VPLYDTLGADSVQYVVKQTSLRAIVCSEAEIANVLKVAEMEESLKTIIQMEPVSSQLKARGEAAGLTILGFEEVEALGAAKAHPVQPPHSKELAFFCYTSGTTGDSKGAMITHEGIVSCLAACRAAGLDMFGSDVHLSYLPLPHVFERSIQMAMIYGGGRIGFYQGDTLKILEDLACLRPTVFPSVPRLLNRVHDKIQAGVEEAGGLKAQLFRRALAAKTSYLQTGSDASALGHMLWDKLVFGPLKQRLGFDRLRLMVTGSAPIAPHVMNFLRAVFGVPVLEGYGQTESSTAISLTSMYDFTLGHVGAPLPCNEVRLDDVAEMGYTQNDTVHPPTGESCLGRGEIVFRGPNVFEGYYAMEDKTAETIDDKGWCYTGDIAMWTPEGKLKIIDRKKNIFKLSQGEYVAAEKIENVVAQSPFVAQAFVYGDSLQSVLVAVIVPNAEYIEPWAKEQQIAVQGMEALCQTEAVQAAVLADLTAYSKKAELKGFEMVKAIHLEPAEFSVDNGLLTPTFKLKRPQAKTKYEPVIDAMYQKLNSKTKSRL